MRIFVLNDNDTKASMNQINPKKLQNSKWTAKTPQNKEKHFLVTEVEVDENEVVISCVLQGVMSKSEYEIKWRDLKDDSKWLFGWK